MINISTIMATKILDKRSSPCGVEYRCELEPLWLPADLVKEAFVDLVRQYGESSSFPFHVQRLNPTQASSHASQAILDEGAAGNGQEA
jgi:hypothetical protein